LWSHFCAQFSCVLSIKTQNFRQFIGETILKIITSVTGN
jgi:hypothetical protein